MTSGTTSTLDEAAALRRRDPGGMLGHIADFPAHMRAAWSISRAVELPDEHRAAASLAVLGMGGSAICADLVRSIFSDRLNVPIVSVRDYELPAWVDRRTLVVAVSHSGATEETISALTTALERRCPVAVITTGGPIGEVAARAGLSRLIYPDQTPPRAALGYTLILLAGLLERAGFLTMAETEIDDAVRASKSVIRACGAAVPTETNLAKQLAWALVDRLPFIEGSGFLAPVARRWKAQLNENAKTGAVAEELPEATHNTVVGYDQPDNLRDHLYVVFLGSPSDHPRNAHRAALSSELLAAVGISYQMVSIGGEGRLGQAAGAITLGDYVSAYLAFLYGMDPSPTTALSHVKVRMSAFDEIAGDADD